MLIAWGGVAAQLVVAIPILTVATIFDRRDFGYAAPAIAFLGYVNVVMLALAEPRAGGGDRQLTPAPSSTCRA